jgi:hypothetical protein
LLLKEISWFCFALPALSLVNRSARFVEDLSSRTMPDVRSKY